MMKKILFDQNKNIISQQLKLERIRQGLSQGQLAAKLQILGASMDQQMISRIEHNQRMVSDYELACFCCALKISPETLLQEFFQTYADRLP